MPPGGIPHPGQPVRHRIYAPDWPYISGRPISEGTPRRLIAPAVTTAGCEEVFHTSNSNRLHRCRGRPLSSRASDSFFLSRCVRARTTRRALHRIRLIKIASVSFVFFAMVTIAIATERRMLALRSATNIFRTPTVARLHRDPCAHHAHNYFAMSDARATHRTIHHMHLAKIA